MDWVEEARRIHRSRPVVDGHNDLAWALREQSAQGNDAIDLMEHQPELHTDLPRLRSGGVGVQFWSVWVPASQADPFRTTVEQIKLVHSLAKRYPEELAMAGSSDEARSIAASGKLAGLTGAEGGHSIENSLDALQRLHELGVRYLTLTHTRTTDWADSATDEPRHGGLTDFGRDVVREMNRLGMLVDLSHTAPATMHAALDVTVAPAIASHSSAFSLAAHPRNVPDDLIERIAAGGDAFRL
jgi:membrane dipeptidase